MTESTSEYCNILQYGVGDVCVVLDKNKKRIEYAHIHRTRTEQKDGKEATDV